VDNANADALSRLPLTSSADGTGARLDPVWQDCVIPPHKPLPVSVFLALAVTSIDDSCPSLQELEEDTSEPYGPHACFFLSDPVNTATLSVRATRAVHDSGAPVPPADEFGCRFVGAMDACSVILVELFGGLGAGLEACLRNGVVIKRYIYCDIDPVAQAAVRDRMCQLSAAFPSQFPPHLHGRAMSSAPMDVTRVTAVHVHTWLRGAHHTPVLVVAGWPCQDLSAAGSGAGLSGTQSGLFTNLWRIWGLVVRERSHGLAAYLFENVVPDVSYRRDKRKHDDAAELESQLGTYVTCDAARMGSYAHRHRAFWTNLQPPSVLQSVVDAHVRQPRVVDDILEPGRTAPPVLRADIPPFYPCNVVGKPMAALPTLVLHPLSHSFRDDKPGTMLNPDGTRSQPTVSERARALGYADFLIRSLNERQQFDVLGRVMDRFCLEALVAALLALGRCSSRLPTVVVTQAEPLPQPAYGLAACFATAAESPPSPSNPIHLVFVAQASDCTADIWLDPIALAFLQNGTAPPPEQRKRVHRRCRLYRWDSTHLLRVYKDGSTRIVTSPAHRHYSTHARHHRSFWGAPYTCPFGTHLLVEIHAYSGR
jgi:hypothetical protein